VYPLSQASNPPPTVFIDVKDVVFDSTIRYDESFFEGLNRIVQSEPWLDRDRIMIDQLRSLGIEKGKPFAPTAETKRALIAGIREAQMSLAARYDAGLPPISRARAGPSRLLPNSSRRQGPALQNPTAIQSTRVASPTAMRTSASSGWVQASST
jgi:hypothetical protein